MAYFNGVGELCSHIESHARPMESGYRLISEGMATFPWRFNAKGRDIAVATGFVGRFVHDERNKAHTVGVFAWHGIIAERMTTGWGTFCGVRWFQQKFASESNYSEQIAQLKTVVRVEGDPILDERLRDSYGRFDRVDDGCNFWSIAQSKNATPCKHAAAYFDRLLNVHGGARLFSMFGMLHDELIEITR